MRAGRAWVMGGGGWLGRGLRASFCLHGSLATRGLTAGSCCLFGLLASWEVGLLSSMAWLSRHGMAWRRVAWHGMA